MSPINGMCALGHTRWIRINSDKNIPVNTATSARKKYWIPITLWSRLKIHFRIKPCGAACAWAAWAAKSWVAILLFLRLPCRQPLSEFFSADDLYNSVHLVMPQPAKLRAGKFILSGLNGREMHVNRQARYGILFKAHGRYKEAVNHIVRAENHFDFAIHRHDHDSVDHIIFRSWIRGIQSQRSRTAEGSVLQLRLGRAKFSVRPGVSEIPRKLHSGNFHLQSVRLRRVKPLGRPDGAARQVQSNKKNDGEDGPHDLQGRVAVRIVRWL